MTVSAGGPDRPAADEAGAGDYLGGTPDEIALFALAHKPRRYAPLTDEESSILEQAVAGTLPAPLSRQARELIKRNAAAVEFVMSEQLLASANRKEPLPATLSNRILSRTRPATTGVPALPRRSSVFWRYGWALPAAAALVAAFSFYGMNRPENPNFEIAALDDEEILAGPEGKSMEILGSPRETGPLDYVETALPRASLADFFDRDQRNKGASESRTLSQLAAAAHQKGKPEFLFDASVEKSLEKGRDEMIPVRIYDLAAPANRPLLASLHLQIGRLAAHLRSEGTELVAVAPSLK